VLPPAPTNNPARTPLPGGIRSAQWYCLRLSLRHYENFFVLGPLTPPRLIPHLAALYAFCRHSDDLADEIAERGEAALRLDAWEDELRRSLGGYPGHPIAAALTHTVRQFDLPHQPLFDLLSAFRQDLSVTRYATFRDLRDYTRRSADPVGRLVLRLYGYQDDELDAISDFVCTGLQLANFCQDVGHDAELGRIYIPLEDFRRFEVDPVDVLNRHPSAQLNRLLHFQVVRAYKFLNAGAHLPEKLVGRLRYSLRLFVYGGMQVLNNVQRDPLLALRRRVKVSARQKLGALAAGFHPLVRAGKRRRGARP